MYVWLNTLTIKVISWKTTWWILLLPVLDDASWRVPTCPDAFWRIPTRSDAFWRILTCCDGLWSVATCRRLGPRYLFKFWGVGWWITFLMTRSDVFRRVQTHSYASRRILTHLDTLWRTLMCCHLPTLRPTSFVQTLSCCLADESRDLSQTKKKITVVNDEQIHKMTIIFTQNGQKLSFCEFAHL